MRTVSRRHTRQEWTPPAPWTYREEMKEGAPRVCRSNLYQTVLIGTAEVGSIDRMLHLYTHWGMTEVSAHVKVDGEWFLVYDLETEWRIVLESAFWIEYASDKSEAVARISRADAVRFGSQKKYGTRWVWAVPFGKYQTHRRG
jgi:hypothetical protein